MVKKLIILASTFCLMQAFAGDVLSNTQENNSWSNNKDEADKTIANQSCWANKIGVTYNSFNNLSKYEKPGVVYEVLKAFYTEQLITISTGASFSLYNGIMKNVSRGWLGVSDVIIRYSDINYTLVDLSFPILFKLEANPLPKSTVYIEAGPRIDLSLYNSATESLIKWSNEPMERWKDLVFDTSIDNNRKPTLLRNSGFSFDLRFGLRIRRFDFNISYLWPLSQYENVGNFCIEKRLHAFAILLGYRIY